MRNLLTFSFTIFLLLIFCPTFVKAAPSISNITDNQNDYPGQVPKYEKLEVTFDIGNSVADNFIFPYDPAPPAGITGQGITVYGEFTSPGGTVFQQPAFYYQTFQDQVKANKEWFYPTNGYSWKVRFTPNETGTWQYKLKATDASGSTTSNTFSFDVENSSNHGFLKVSPADPRYFEYDNGKYFPALGFNLNGGSLDNVNPVLGNTEEFTTMAQNGIQLSRVWISQFSIFGEAWGKWVSTNRVLNPQEPRIGVVNKVSGQFARYPALVPPNLPVGSEYYMWLNFDETIEGSDQPYFSPCRSINPIAVKQNTQYRVKVRYHIPSASPVEGPSVAGQPFGFGVKTATNGLGATNYECNEPSTGTVVAATYNSGSVTDDPQNPGWKILEDTFTTGATDFLPYLFMGFINADDTTGDLQGGHVFVDKIWLEEASCSSNCPNLVHKPWMSMHYYLNQRDAYAFDKLLDFAHQKGIYLKAVMNEKNDRIFQTIDFNGQPAPNQSVTNFYGNLTAVTKVRWLQQAWWRYMQARWGYSPNIHSWELLNEGDTNSNHFTLTNEFGKYMKCRVFGIVPAGDTSSTYKCAYDHPDAHMISTSFHSQNYPWQFWNNGGNANNYSLYQNIDYADQHYYADVSDTSALGAYYDSAQFSYNLSNASNFSANTVKPFIRGETAWSPPASTFFETNAENGEWLHDFIWAGINKGGLMEHFFAGGNFTKQIYDLTRVPPHDHRSMFKPFYDFIENIPLNNGNYEDIVANISNTNIRAWGQKDLVNNRAHLWIANKNHSWPYVAEYNTDTIVGFSVKATNQTHSKVYTFQNPSNSQTTSTGNITVPTDSHFSLTNNNCSNQTIQPGGNCTLTVNYNPDTSQPVFTGEFTIPYTISGSGSTSRVVKLFGARVGWEPSGSVALSGFTPNTTLPIETWNTYTGVVINTSTITSDGSGNITLNVTNLPTDTAIKIGDYPPSGQPPAVPGDANGDMHVNIQDFSILSSQFGQNGPSLSADFNGDNQVNIQDFSILSANFGL